MCDILIAGPTDTKEGIFIFAKNSDRDPNEAQVIEFIKGGKLDTDRIKLTYVEIELSKLNTLKNASRTNTVLLSRPWWIWGAEMGANEHGLVIGNTAVFTKKVNKNPGVLGMDIIRLALMFKSSAFEAVETITEIIEKFGQGGNGSYEHRLFYDNSFIVADPTEAYVVESAGNDWVVKRVNSYSISNRLTISNDWDKCSEGINELLSETKSKFNFAKIFSDSFFTFFAHGSERCNFTRASLNRNNIDLFYMIKVLSSTDIKDGKFIHVSPEKGSMSNVCMHYGGLLRPSQTASSQISELYKDLQVHWITGTSLPCLSIFKPVYFLSGLPNLDKNTTNKYNPQSYWWYAEKFHRGFQLVYDELIDEFSREREDLQKKIIESEREIRSKYLQGVVRKDELYKLTSWAFELERDLISKWEGRISKISKRGKVLYRLIWSRVNKKAGINF
jgi:dipeptidase